MGRRVAHSRFLNPTDNNRPKLAYRGFPDDLQAHFPSGGDEAEIHFRHQMSATCNYQDP